MTVLRRCSLESLEPRAVPSGIPILHSLPGAPHSLFLDFDGHVTEGSGWNVELPRIHSPPFDLDGQPYVDGVPSFNSEEQRRMHLIWARMAEDFRPFNVNVTTADPSIEHPDVFQVGNRAQRVVFSSPFDDGLGGSGVRWFHPALNGIAIDSSWSFPGDTPVWVFSTHELAGEIGSHEAAHAFGLGHHGGRAPNGDPADFQGEWGQGETRWSPIMGHGNALSQWSRGDYPHATNQQDDLAILAQSLGYRADDHMGMVGFDIARQVNHVHGVIGKPSDVDTFSITLPAPETTVRIRATPWVEGPNLDIALSVIRDDGTVLHTRHDPHVNPRHLLSSSVETTLPAGTYFVQVTGTGKPATDGDPGYSDYGSLGAYRLQISVGEETASVLTYDDITALRQQFERPYERTHDWHYDGLINERDVDAMLAQWNTSVADFNLDGRVDFADFVTLSSNFGVSDSRFQDGDINGDGTVDLLDFARFRDEWARRQGSRQ